MKTRNRIVAAGLTAVAVAGLTVGVAVAADSSTGRTGPTSTTNMPMGSMDPATMADGSMMDDMSSMAGMMGGSDMGAMHDAMHAMMRGAMPDAALAACDQAHVAMTEVTTPSTNGPATSIDHAAHHTGS